MMSKWEHMVIDTSMMFDVQVKRIHAYKRQFVNVLHCVALYNQLKSGETKDFFSRTGLFGEKSAPVLHGKTYD